MYSLCPAAGIGLQSGFDFLQADIIWYNKTINSIVLQCWLFKAPIIRLYNIISSKTSTASASNLLNISEQ